VAVIACACAGHNSTEAATAPTFPLQKPLLATSSRIARGPSIRLPMPAARGPELRKISDRPQRYRLLRRGRGGGRALKSSRPRVLRKPFLPRRTAHNIENSHPELAHYRTRRPYSQPLPSTSSSPLRRLRPVAHPCPALQYATATTRTNLRKFDAMWAQGPRHGRNRELKTNPTNRRTQDRWASFDGRWCTRTDPWSRASISRPRRTSRHVTPPTTPPHHRRCSLAAAHRQKPPKLFEGPRRILHDPVRARSHQPAPVWKPATVPTRKNPNNRNLTLTAGTLKLLETARIPGVLEKTTHTPSFAYCVGPHEGHRSADANWNSSNAQSLRFPSQPPRETLQRVSPK